jgi:hypothetical protein
VSGAHAIGTATTAVLSMLLRCLRAAASQKDFMDSLRKVNPSVGKADLERFQVWMNEFGSA